MSPLAKTLRARTPAVGQPVDGFYLQVRCRHCNGGLVRVAEGQEGPETWAVARCVPCGRDWCPVVLLTDVTAERQRGKAA